MTEGVYSVRGAARRVHRSRRTIQYWLRDGMPWHQEEGNPAKLIEEEHLTQWLRMKILANPVTPRRRDTSLSGARDWTPVKVQTKGPECPTSTSYSLR